MPVKPATGAHSTATNEAGALVASWRLRWSRGTPTSGPSSPPAMRAIMSAANRAKRD